MSADRELRAEVEVEVEVATVWRTLSELAEGHGEELEVGMRRTLEALRSEVESEGPGNG